MRLSTCPRGAWQKDFSVISSLVSTGFISFLLLFFPHWQLCECEYATVWEKVGLEKAHLSFTGNYWLGLELRNKISHGNHSHFGLCHIFHSVQLFPFATPFFFFSLRIPFTQADKSSRWGDRGDAHTSHPQTDIEPLQWIIGSLFFVRNDQLLKGTLNMKDFKDFLKVWSDWNFGFQRAFITTFCCWCLMSQGSQVLLASQLTLTSPVGGKVVCCVFRPIKRHLWGKKKKKSSVFFNIYWFIILFPAEPPEPLCGLENVTIDNRGEVVGGGGWNVNFEGTVSFMWCGNFLLRK